MVLQSQVPISILIVCILATAILTISLVSVAAYLILRARNSKPVDYEQANTTNAAGSSLQASPAMEEMPYVIDLHRSYAGPGTYVGRKSLAVTNSPTVSPGGDSDGITSSPLTAVDGAPGRGGAGGATPPPTEIGGRSTPVREMPGCTTWSKQDMSPPPAVWNPTESEDRAGSHSSVIGSVRSGGRGWS